MSKIFAGELIGEEIALGFGLAPETAGLSVPLTFASIGVVAMIHAIKNKKQQKENSRREEEERNRIDEANRQEQERQRQLDLERIARQQEEERMRQEEEARRAEEARIQAEQLARQQAQEQAEAQRAQENQQNIQNMENRNIAIEDQMLADRQARINQLQGRDVSVYANYYDPNNPGNVLFFAPENEQWRLISGNQINQRGGLPNLNPYRPRADYDNPNLPYPDGDADDPPDGPGGYPGGGGGYPGGDPGGNHFNQQGDANNRNNNGNNYYIGNPYSEVIRAISEQIARNQNRERPAPTIDSEDDPNKRILGGDPATWSPSPDNPYNPGTQKREVGPGTPGYNGGGVQKKDSDIYAPDYITKNDDTHLLENELLQIINAQGLSELNQEATLASTTKTVTELQNLEARVQNLIPAQVQVNPSSIFSSTLSRF